MREEMKIKTMILFPPSPFKIGSLLLFSFLLFRAKSYQISLNSWIVDFNGMLTHLGLF